MIKVYMLELLLVLLSQSLIKASNWDHSSPFTYPVILGANKIDSQISMDCLRVNRASGDFYMAGALNGKELLYYKLGQDDIQVNGQNFYISTPLQTSQNLKVNFCFFDHTSGFFDVLT